MSGEDKAALRRAIPSWMDAMGWDWTHTARWLRRRQRRGLV